MGEILKTEKTTQLILGIFAILLLVIYFLASLGKADWTKYIIVITSFVLGLILILEAGVFNYFQTKSYKKISFGDILIWASMLLAGGVFLNGALMIGAIKETSPMWLQTFATVSGSVISGVGIVVAVIFMLTPRIKS